MTDILNQIDDETTIDIWSIPLDQTALAPDQSPDNILDTAEYNRYQNLHPKHQHRYLVSHVACRHILSQYSAIKATEICYSTNKHGKPQLNHSNIFFNLSHSHDLAVLAISKTPEIGVDVEYIKPKPDWFKLARRYFHQSEVDYLAQENKSFQEKAFLQTWTRKEAFIKALGTGLSTPLASFDTSKTGTISTNSATINEKQWFQQDLQLSNDYVASVVQNTQIRKIRYYLYKNNNE